MIQANELRIGNIIMHDETGMLCKVLCIDELGLSVEFPNTEITWIELDQFSPIHLTPEILEKLGWVWNERCDSFEGKDVRMNLQHRPVNGSYIMFNYILKVKMVDSIFYVQQLQNLYFALTGEELDTTKLLNTNQ